ncbi:RHS repeat-associated core domain-containing protein [Alteraurantiacibacter aestuarii]|uniref:RHS repeat-associated core domain-containing protein n=1 Tax=Alteraurantiacibacter aestuarii TaxID=650004 RepID=UPI0031D5EF51
MNTYDDYGVPAAPNSGRFQYTGQAWLPELGLYYYKARMYSPTPGRFMQTDPIGYADGSVVADIIVIGCRNYNSVPLGGGFGGAGLFGFSDPFDGHLAEYEEQLARDTIVVTAKRDDGPTVFVTADAVAPQSVEAELPYDRRPGSNNVLDGCTGVPDIFPRSCAAHDVCYQTRGIPRGQCDREFHANMHVERPELFEPLLRPPSSPNITPVAPQETYFVGVRLFGGDCKVARRVV